MSIKSYLMAKFYDKSMSKMEAACLSAWRRELLLDISGDVLEIGSGTGVNLSYYQNAISRLILTEPEPHMLNLLKDKITTQHNGKYTTEAFAADALGFPDNSFDAVVSTLVLCSVDSPETALMEIKRVLKPEGKLYFIEHVLANEIPHLIKWQKFFQPVWVCMCGNCHLTRDTEKSIAQAGFTFHNIERVRSSGGPAIVIPMIKGVASNRQEQS